MNNYETLLAEYDGTLTIAEEKMINLGLYCDGYIWINSQQTTSKKLVFWLKKLVMTKQVSEIS